MQISFFIWHYLINFFVWFQVPGTFSGQSDHGLTFSPPGYDVTEGTAVTFTCKADVGTEPQGQLGWYYYLSDMPYLVSDQATKGHLVSARKCSSSQQSRLTLTMNSTFDGIVVRCTLQQDILSPDGDAHNQTNKFSVKCKYIYAGSGFQRTC